MTPFSVEDKTDPIERDARPTVLQLIASLPAHGAEQLLLDVLENADHKRFRFLVCAVAAGGPLVEEIRQIGIPVIVFEKRFKLDFSTLFKIRKLIRQEHVDLVHTHLFTADAWGRTAAILSGVNAMVRTAHNSDLWKKWPHRLTDRLLLNRTHKFIAVSESVRDYLISLEKVPPQKIVWVANGINMKRFERSFSAPELRAAFGIQPQEQVVAIIGRLEPVKGHRVFLEAAKELAQKHSGVRFLIVGDGPLRKELESKAQEEGLKEKVVFTGLRRDIPSILRILDCFVMASTREGLPIVLLEAMAAAVPIVATPVGGIPEVISDKIQGLLVSPENPAALSAAMGWMLEHKQEAAQMGNQARSLVQAKYNVERTAHQIEAVYDEVLTSASRCNAPRPFVQSRSEQPSPWRRAGVSAVSSCVYPLARLKAATGNPGVRVLMYHRIAPTSRYDHLVVRPPRFEEQMRFLKSEGYETISLDHLAAILQARREIPSRSVVITFDDGYKDNFETAFPILQRYGYAATVFLVPGFINGTAQLPRYAGARSDFFLSWKEVDEMSRHGICFGSHSCTHQDLTALSPPEAEFEISKSKEILEGQLHRSVEFFSYPRGLYTPLHAAMVKACGYRAACSTRPGANGGGADLFALRRTEISPGDTLWDFEKKLAGAFDFLHKAWQWSRSRREAVRV